MCVHGILCLLFLWAIKFKSELFIYLFIDLSIYLSIFLFIYLTLYLFILLLVSFFVFVPAALPVHVRTLYMYVYIACCLLGYCGLLILKVYLLFFYLFQNKYLFIYLFIFLSIYLFLYLFIILFLYLFLSCHCLATCTHVYMYPPPAVIMGNSFYRVWSFIYLFIQRYLSLCINFSNCMI